MSICNLIDKSHQQIVHDRKKQKKNPTHQIPLKLLFGNENHSFRLWLFDIHIVIYK